MPPAEKKTTTAVAVRPRGISITNIGELVEFAALAYKSGVLPKGVNKPETAAMLIATGLDMGLSPAQSLRSLMIVNGRFSVWGDAMLGLVESSGLLESIAERIEGEGDAMKAVCVVRRKGRNEAVSEFTWADAKRAGLDTKDTYKQYPKRMLPARARSNALRDNFADVLCGMCSVEEMQEVVASREEPESDVRIVEQPTLPAPVEVATADVVPSNALGHTPEVVTFLTDAQRAEINELIPAYMGWKGIEMDSVEYVKKAWVQYLKPYGATKTAELTADKALGLIVDLKKLLESPVETPWG